VSVLSHEEIAPELPSLSLQLQSKVGFAFLLTTLKTMITVSAIIGSHLEISTSGHLLYLHHKHTLPPKPYFAKPVRKAQGIFADELLLGASFGAKPGHNR
jgi:hypothetical protein